MLGGQVLERREAFSHRAYLLDRERAAVSVERADRLAYAEVARGPRRGTSERTSEKPVPVQRPRPRTATRVSTTSASGSVPRRSRSSSERASPTTYSALR